jgi:hypothetical protein
MSVPGLTWHDARHEMDLPKLAALNRYWDHSPPVHILVARYLGVKPKAKPAPEQVESQADDLMQLIISGAL